MRQLSVVLAGVLVIGLVQMVQAPLAVAAVPVRCAEVVLPIAGGVHESYALNSDGTVWAAGDNFYGQLGDGTRIDRATPVQVTGLTDVVSVSTGFYSAMALKSDGSLWAWGWNANGQLGIGSTMDQDRPVRVPIDNVVQVANGYYHTLTLKEDGTLWVWGLNDRGQLGLGDTTNRQLPVQLSGIPPVAQISAGGYQSGAVLKDGTVATWGPSAGGTLGYDVTAPDGLQKTPRVIPGFRDVTQISVAVNHTLALKTDSSAWSWGDNSLGQLGDGTSGSGNQRTTPGRVLNLPSVRSVSAGASYSMAVTTSGQGMAWGSNDIGQLGDGSTNFLRTIPVAISGISDIKVLEAGTSSSSSALTGDGKVYFWGLTYRPGPPVSIVAQRTPLEFTAARQVAPGSPTDLQAVPGQQLAYLYWKKGPGVVTQYDVTTYVNGNVGTSLAVSQPSLHGVVRNLSASAQYTFTVAGQNCLGSSAPTPRSAPVVPVGTASSNSSFSVEGEQFTDRLSAKVDTATGNLRIMSDDVKVAGTGIDLEISRFYNSKAEVSNIEWFGRAWSSNVGRDVQLIEYWASPTVQSMRYIGPGGFSAYFIRNPDGSYEPPPGVNAQLVRNADNTYTLTEDSSGLRQEFNNLGTLVAQSDRYGNRIQMQYDSNALLTRIIDSQNRLFDIGYNANRDVASIRDATGRLWQYQYDADLNLTLYIDPAGGRTQFGYDPTRLLTRIITPEGRQITFTYDSDRRVKSIRYPLAPGSPVTLFDYRPATDAGSSTAVTDANGHPTTYTFDPAGRTTQVADGLGNVTAASYTSRSNISTLTSGTGDTTRLGYDLARNLISARAATGAEQRADFTDPAHPHSPTALIDTQGNAVSYSYDPPGSVTTARNQLPTENQVTMTYNADGTPATSTDARGARTTYSTDVQGNLSVIAPPAPLGTLRLSYDGLSRVTRLIDGAGKQRTFTYDPLDRLTSVTYGDGSVVRRDYDRDGNLITTTEVDATTTQTTRMYYDQHNRLFQRDEPTGRSVRYTYDPVGNLTTMTDSGGTVTYSYDAANLLRSITEPGGARTTMDYDAAYNRTVTAYPNGVSLNRTYDDSNRLATISAVRGGQTLFRKTYTYTKPSGSFPDSALRHQVSELDGTSTVYTYDANNRLTLARTQNPGDGSLIESYEYTLDGNGNRRNQFVDKPGTTNDTTDNYTYNAADQLVNRSGETFSYDGAGNLLTSNAGANFTYNAANQTTSIRRVTGGATATYDYRGDGQAERTIAGIAGSSADVSYGHTQLGISNQHSSAGDLYFTRDPSGGLLGQRGPGGTQYYLTDGLGSVIMVTAADGSTTATYTYDPFGNTTTATGNTSITPWHYAGQYQDPTGLYKIGERYYDPKLGRWTQPDQYLSSPLDPRNANRYLYTGANPINYTDTTGLSACDNIKIFNFLGLAIGAPIAVLGYLFGARKFRRIGAALSLLRGGLITFSKEELAKVPGEVVAQLGAELRLIGATTTAVTEFITRPLRISLGC